MARSGQETTFWDHLDEFRGVLLRCAIYIGVATAGTWAFREQIFDLLRYPAIEGAKRAGLDTLPFRIFEPAGGIVLMMQASLVAGLILSAPLWLMELVRFVTPGLHKHERRAALFLIPVAVLLFAGGAAFCYWISPAAFGFLFKFNLSLGVLPEVTLVSYLHFLLRLLVVFGLVFEMPLVIMFLVHFGVVGSVFLLRGWRVALVVIFIVAAIATPTTDPITMLLMAGPMIVLYFISILLGRMVERRRREPVVIDDDDPYGLRTGDEGLTDAPPPSEPPPPGE